MTTHTDILKNTEEALRRNRIGSTASCGVCGKYPAQPGKIEYFRWWEQKTMIAFCSQAHMFLWDSVKRLLWP